MKQHLSFLILLMAVISCQSGSDKSAKYILDKESWIDTVRSAWKLPTEKRQQVYFARNFEEDYQKVDDTARIMLRFFWNRSFHPALIVRLENRPEFYDSAGVVKKYEEWFATYKEDISRLNHTCPLQKNDKCLGRVRPFVHRQSVEILPVNQRPKVLNVLDSIGYWKMKPIYSAGPHTDGSSWTLQVYYKGRKHEVTTDLDNHPIKTVCLQLVKLSHYPVKPDEVY